MSTHAQVLVGDNQMNFTCAGTYCGGGYVFFLQTDGTAKDVAVVDNSVPGFSGAFPVGSQSFTDFEFLDETALEPTSVVGAAFNVFCTGYAGACIVARALIRRAMSR